MIQEVHITTIEQLMPLFFEQEWREDIHRNRGQYVYRGMRNIKFDLSTSLSRCCKEKQQQLEPAILNNFAKYAVIEDPSIAQSVWRQMILGQHYGLPTRLLDWSHSALVGLHFATAEDDLSKMDQHDSMVWRIDMHELHELLPVQYREVMRDRTVFTVDMLGHVTNSLRQYDEDMGDHAMVVIEPPSINARIVNQYSFFSVIPSGMTDVEQFLDKNTKNTVKYVIDKSLRWRIRDMLDQLNISERIVYPGLEGLSKWIGRHYFVK